MPRTAVVILNWNGRQWLEKFLGRLISFSPPPLCEVYVADNGSTDDSLEWLRENHPSMRVIRLDKNYGFAGGYNMALDQVDAEYYILVNSDIEVTEGWAEKLTAFMDAHPEAAACQPKILSLSKRDHFEYAGAAGGYIDKFGYPFCRGRIFDITEKDEGQYDDIAEVFWTSGACMIIRSSAWKRCKGLDPSFFAHMEEIDLCWRMLLSGYRLYYCPGPVVYHAGGGALPYDSPYKTYLNFRNNLFLLYKNLPEERFRRTMLARKILDGLSAIFFLVKGRFGSIGSIWKAHMDFYRSIAELREKRKTAERTNEENPARLILNKSIVFEFYIKGNRRYKELKMNLPEKE